MNAESTLGGLRQAAAKKARQERNIQMLRDYLIAGEECSEIARRQGLSTGHVRQILDGLVRRHHSLGPEFERHRLPDDLDAKLRELRERSE